MPLQASALEFFKAIGRELHEAQKPVRILRALAWQEVVARDFFGSGAKELPRPVYCVPAETDGVAARFSEIARKVRGGNEVERLLRETCESYQIAACMLGAIGTSDFHRFSCDLYGRPSSVACDGKTTNLALAQHFDTVITQYAEKEGPARETPLGAEEVAEELGRRLGKFFSGHAIRVQLDDTIAANAVAGADVVRIKRGATFSERDLLQLEIHEGHVHVATTLNGRSQPHFPFLGSGAPRTTTTQEGLAIFTEFTSGAIDLERLRRLTDRILAIQMSEQGADFLDLYRFFLEHGHTETQAFDCARRVVRGGRVDGSAPFTKDVCYLDGLLRVSNFLRVTITKGHAEYVPLLFVGKLDLDDLPLVAHLYRDGVIAPPRFLPRWAQDVPFLTAYMSFAAFLNQTDLVAERRYYENIIERAAAEWQAE